MITDEERREIAAKFREQAECDKCDSCGECKDVCFVDLVDFGDTVLDVLSVRYKSYRICFNRLADLIEPACDRDALLALADELSKPMRDGGYGSGIARRIREACGAKVVER